MFYFYLPILFRSRPCSRIPLMVEPQRIKVNKIKLTDLPYLLFILFTLYFAGFRSRATNLVSGN